MLSSRGSQGMEVASEGTVMRMNVVVLDPPGFPFAHFLFDTVRMLQLTLLELGVDTTLTRNKLESNRLNVLCGIHHLAGETEVNEVLRTEEDFIVLQTEMVHGRTINREANSRVDDVVLPLCSQAKAVWDSSPDNIVALASLGVEAKLLRFGFQERMIEVPERKRDVDFFFYGSITRERADVLAKLARLGYRVESCFDSAALFRNDLIARSEIALTLRQSAEMPHLPHARIIYLVTNKVLVAGQGGVNEEPLLGTFLRADQGDVVEFLRQTRARTDRQELRESHHAVLRKQPMRDFVEPLLQGLV